MGVLAESPRDRGVVQDGPVLAAEALQRLKGGNRRVLDGQTRRSPTGSSEDWRDIIEARQKQNPFVAILGCVDSLCSPEMLFDVDPGDIFMCRNAGNTSTHAQGSMVGTLEFCVSSLRVPLILVLGHTQCRALEKAVETWQQKSLFEPKTAEDALLQGLVSVVDVAARDLGPGASQGDIAHHAVMANVRQSLEFLLQFSKPIREAVLAGTLQVHGAVHNIESGEVKFLEPSSRPLSKDPENHVLLQSAGAGGTISSQQGDTAQALVAGASKDPQCWMGCATTSTAPQKANIEVIPCPCPKFAIRAPAVPKGKTGRRSLGAASSSWQRFSTECAPSTASLLRPDEMLQRRVGFTDDVWT